MENGGCQRSGCRLLQYVFRAEHRTAAQQVDISPRILHERIAAFEALGQFFLPCNRCGQTVDQLGAELLRLRMRAEPGHRIFHRLRGGTERIVVAEQAGPRLQHVAMQRRLGQREIIEGSQRRRIGWRVGVDAAQQQPGEQREQQ
jgi:hypothetical protein